MQPMSLWAACYKIRWSRQLRFILQAMLRRLRMEDDTVRHRQRLMPPEEPDPAASFANCLHAEMSFREEPRPPPPPPPSRPP